MKTKSTEGKKEEVTINNVGLSGFPDTGWRCAVCYGHAQVLMIDVTLCVAHAKRYNFGYGDSLKSLREEQLKYEQN